MVTDEKTQELFDSLNAEQDVLQKAVLVQTLVRDREVSVKRIGRAIQKHPSYVSHLLRLIKIPQIVVDGYYGKLITATHLMSISRLSSETEIIEAYQEILAHNLNVSQTETLIRRLRYDVAEETIDVDLRQLAKKEKELRDDLEAKVTILQTRVRAKIVIEKRGKISDTSQFLSMIIERLQTELTDEEKGRRLKVLE